MFQFVVGWARYYSSRTIDRQGSKVALLKQRFDPHTGPPSNTHLPLGSLSTEEGDFAYILTGFRGPQQALDILCIPEPPQYSEPQPAPASSP
ncbi:hypothetical protein PGT21_019569 [Puccinia graminis f. sp. tritici]|uniref:Uncharacterized protein n=1 Tax=Puccinia graminis f. sp. tritici TaxID=56615 RepID=A0A5B0PKF3_PUCGR|nr:hypothetical protein PGT21_019569 [Puccinia graminis f. sp. tritici]